MEDLFNEVVIVILLVIIMLYAVLRGVKAATNRKRNICTRCDGEGYIQLRDEEIICNRCKGTGELLGGKNYKESRMYDSWE